MLTPYSVKRDGIVRLSVALAATPGDFDQDDEDLAPKRYRWKFPEVLPGNEVEWEQALSHVALPKLARGEVRQLTKVNGKTTQELTAPRPPSACRMCCQRRPRPQSGATPWDHSHDAAAPRCDSKCWGRGSVQSTHAWTFAPESTLLGGRLRHGLYRDNEGR